jgi:hypothetical protein
MSKQLCIYHGNCADGFGAAWVVRKALADQSDLAFHAGVYSDPPPDVEGMGVWIVDFSYKRPTLLAMSKVADGITILDHHKTAKDELVNMPANVDATFDMEHSGAILTWEYFYGDKEPPQLLKHIEDRDLWRFHLAGTREIQANVFSYPYDFNVWDELMQRPVDDLLAEGRAIERKHFKDIHELLGIVTRRMTIGGYNVPIANLPYIHVSDAAHELAKGEPFAGCYWDTPKGRVFGLRSTDAGVDVSEIAKQYGGGGHRNASGFTVSYAIATAMEDSSPRNTEGDGK